MVEYRAVSGRFNDMVGYPSLETLLPGKRTIPCREKHIECCGGIAGGWDCEETGAKEKRRVPINGPACVMAILTSGTMLLQTLFYPPADGVRL